LRPTKAERFFLPESRLGTLGEFTRLPKASQLRHGFARLFDGWLYLWQGAQAFNEIAAPDVFTTKKARWA